MLIGYVKRLKLRCYTKEFSQNLKLAIPITIGMLGHSLVQLIDNVMLGQLGVVPLAAVSLGNSIVFVVMSFGLGFSAAITPLTAEAKGSGSTNKCSKIFYHGALLCLVVGIALACIVFASRGLLFTMNQDPIVATIAYSYMLWSGISLIPFMLFQAFKQFIEGLAFTKPAMYVIIATNCFNVVANYFLIFGNWIFPKMGVEGAAISTLLARSFMLLFIIVYVGNKAKVFYYLKSIKVKSLDVALFKKMFWFCLPTSLQIFFETIFFISAVWISGTMGVNPQAANQIALNLSSLTYMVAVGLSVTAAIRVGIEKGRKAFEELRRIAFSIFLLMLLFDVVFCLLFLLTRTYLPTIYLNETNPLMTNDVPLVIRLTSELLVISAFFQIFDGAQAVILGALRGLHDVIVPTVLVFMAYVVFGFPVLYLLGITFGLGVKGIWIGLSVGLVVSALLLFVRFDKISKYFIYQPIQKI